MKLTNYFRFGTLNHAVTDGARWAGTLPVEAALTRPEGRGLAESLSERD